MEIKWRYISGDVRCECTINKLQYNIGNMYRISEQRDSPPVFCNTILSVKTMFLTQDFSLPNRERGHGEGLEERNK